MRLGHGSRKRFPWWCWRAMVLVALVTLPGATLVVGADEATVFMEPPRVSRDHPVGALIEVARSELGLNAREAMQLLLETVNGVGFRPDLVRPQQRSAVWSGKTLVVHATLRDHELIAELLETMRTRGFRQISIETRLITGPPGKIEALKIAWPGSLGEVSAPDPEDPSAGTFRPAATNDWAEPPLGHSRARTVREKMLPATLAVLDDEQANALLGQLPGLGDTEPQNSDGLLERARAMLGYDDVAAPSDRVNVLQTPTVTVFNGQSATINDCSQSPFVVSLKAIEGIYQPIIRLVDEGLKLGLRPLLQDDDGSVRLDCELTLSRIVDVDTFTFTSPEDAEGDAAAPGTTLQLPDVETTRVEAAAKVPAGKTLLIGGLKTRDSDGNPQSMLVMLRPTRVVPAGPAAGESARVPNGRTGLVDVAAKEKIARGGLILGGVTPRIIIQEEEEEQLGILVP